ncbi:hypothetical protein ACFO0N_11710 [Halobium salinum]|uniref:Uncharacterized protein n=1 Tax=Halobium salinum TaxID=1364940 RepID=A0ABD5PCI9_9EURY|nr:hypothetical protein [Halobium salinum]
MTQLTYAPRHRTVAEPTPDAVLATFATYQPKTARMVAEEFGIAEETAVDLLERLAGRGDLTKTYGGTETPVWLRPHPNPAQVA